MGLDRVTIMVLPEIPDVVFSNHRGSFPTVDG